MATIEIWIQLENHPWDVCPNWPIDRSEAEGAMPVGSLKQVFMRSPVSGKSRFATVRRPLKKDAVLLRRYTAEWKAPDDRKVNPWDLNELDPTDTGTMGTIPGAIIECNVGDTLRVHFRNLDTRTKNIPAPWEAPGSGELLPAAARAHSLHAHGLTFPSKYDGAYPLSPPDPDQLVTTKERNQWIEIGVTGRYKQGDRVPAGGTFTYIWEARGPASAGVWSYHDHSICDMENVGLGAIGMIVVHNPADKENEVQITADRLPGGSWTGSLLDDVWVLADPIKIGVSQSQLALLVNPTESAHGSAKAEYQKKKKGPDAREKRAADRIIRFNELEIELDENYKFWNRIRIQVYRKPADQTLFLLLFHEMPGVGMCMNGRKYLGNAPTLVAGPKTRMRFGVLGMGETFHTFHIHGHRWVIAGPSGKTPSAIEQSVQVEATSQFQDTTLLGPGSSFAFTIEEGKGLMRPDPPLGEWHMHCHVPMHMMEGMVGSLLVINGGEAVTPLPVGRGCPMRVAEPAPPYQPQVKIWQVRITPRSFDPPDIEIEEGDFVEWINTDHEAVHSVLARKGDFESGPIDPGKKWGWIFYKAGNYEYNCKFHKHEWWYAPGGYNLAPYIHVKPKSGSGGGSSPVPPPPAATTTRDVAITSTGFSPSSITIKAGDTVRWTNQDNTTHDAMADDHTAWGSPNLPQGKVWSHIFAQPGTFGYHCHIHPEMTGTIQVNP
jgi:plastocyanin/FtsP/CotA-like multicopper oxidase with cupredoxin domain